MAVHSGWQMRRKSRAAWRGWAMKIRGDVLCSIKHCINGSFHLINQGQHFNGYNSMTPTIKKGLRKYLADWLSHLKRLLKPSATTGRQYHTYSKREQYDIPQLNWAYSWHVGPVNTWHYNQSWVVWLQVGSSKYRWEYTQNRCFSILKPLQLHIGCQNVPSCAY